MQLITLEAHQVRLALDSPWVASAAIIFNSRQSLDCTPHARTLTLQTA